jgi:four helix bundle protein
VEVRRGREQNALRTPKILLHIRNLPPLSDSSMSEGKYIFPFEKLDVWRMAIDLTEYVLGLLENFPPNQYFRLISQMEGAVTSIAQNIAEGKGRQHKKEFIQFLSIAQGSLYETLTLNEIFTRKKLFSGDESIKIIDMSEAIDRKLNGLMNSLRGKRRMEMGR